jgi:hypothetical protein
MIFNDAIHVQAKERREDDNALGADFNFCTNRNARFGLNIGPNS